MSPPSWAPGSGCRDFRSEGFSRCGRDKQSIHNLYKSWSPFGSAIRTEWDNRWDAPRSSLESVASTLGASTPHRFRPPISSARHTISYHHLLLEESQIQSLAHDEFVRPQSLLADVVLRALVRQTHSLANRVEQKTIMVPEKTPIRSNHISRSGVEIVTQKR